MNDFFGSYAGNTEDPEVEDELDKLAAEIEEEGMPSVTNKEGIIVLFYLSSGYKQASNCR